MNNEFEHCHRTYDAKDMYGQSAVDWEERIDYASLRKKRLEKARAAMKKCDIGALLLLRQDTIRYVTGIWQHPAGHSTPKVMRYTVLAGDADPVQFEIAGADLFCVKRAAPWQKDLRNAKIWASAEEATGVITKEFAREIKDILKQNGVVECKLGIDFIDIAGYEALTKEGLKITDGASVIKEAAMIKCPEELEILKQACAIVDAAFYTCKETLRPGIRETELIGAMANTIFSLGAERIEHITMASGGGTNPLWRHGPTDKMIRVGDMVCIDLVIQYMGYNTCCYRDFVCGVKPSRRQKELYKQCYNSLYGAINKIKPGATTYDVAKVWEKEGYRDDEYGSVSLLQFGHGLGMSVHELPFITLAYSKQYPRVLEKNMYLALETYAGEPGEKECARLEDSMVITDNGVEVFSLYPVYDDFWK